MNPQSENVISWTETLSSGELVMMTQKRSGNIVMHRLDGSDTVVSNGPPDSESKPSTAQPRQ